MSEMAIFAGGCFWCMVSPFYALEGVISIDSGYIGGHLKNPTYEDVKKQKSGHYEAVRIIYDPGLTSYDELLAAFWVQIDPTDPGGQFHDRGPSYRTAIFYQNDHQRREALASKAELENSRRFAAPIVTEILPASQFYVAEEYHQDFHQKNPIAYQADRVVSGRDEFIKKYWGEDYWDLLVKKK